MSDHLFITSIKVNNMREQKHSYFLIISSSAQENIILNFNITGNIVI